MRCVGAVVGALSPRQLLCGHEIPAVYSGARGAGGGDSLPASCKTWGVDYVDYYLIHNVQTVFYDGVDGKGGILKSAHVFDHLKGWEGVGLRPVTSAFLSTAARNCWTRF